MMAIYQPRRKCERAGGGVLRNCEERGKRGDGELVIVTGVTFLCRPFYDFPFSFFFHLLVKN